MKFKTFAKKAFSIQYILIYFVIINMTCTIIFKSKAAQLFTEYERQSMELMSLNNSLAWGNTYTEEDFQAKGEQLKDSYYPFIYFNMDLEDKLDEIIALFSASITEEATDRKANHDKLEQCLIAFQNGIAEKQVVLIFGYDSLLYCSTLMLVIAIFVIIFNTVNQKNELKTFQMRNEEQLKISRNLHDGVAQDLTAMKFYMQQDDKEKTEYYATQALKEVRYLIGALHLDLSDDFEKIVKEILSTFETNYKIKTELLIASDNLSSLHQDIQLEFLRILQEALSNIARHANATKVTIKFVNVMDSLKFIISDNGIGFDMDEVEKKNEEDAGSHYGVHNIQERVQQLGGTVEFLNKGGTTIAITIKDIIH